MQPVYEASPHKLAAREKNASIYRRLTGRYAIPSDRQYWTLAHYQSKSSTSEISQMVSLGLIDKKQFHGVDRDSTIIKQNRVWHPEAHWYAGEWTEIIQRLDFKPALIYLDTTSFADRRAAVREVVTTMLRCRQPETVLFANLMLTDPRTHKALDSNALLESIRTAVPPRELRRWNLEIENYDYASTGKTTMLTYPHEIYKEWTTWGNWFGTGNKHFKDFLPFTKARKLARSLRLKTSAEWVTWYRKHGANKKVPHTPSQTYPKQFRGWADWLGVRNRRCTLSFTQARTAVRRVIRKHKYPLTFLGFVQLKKDGRLPEGVSAQPWLYPQYKGIEDFVGRSVAQPLRWRPRP